MFRVIIRSAGPRSHAASWLRCRSSPIVTTRSLPLRSSLGIRSFSDSGKAVKEKEKTCISQKQTETKKEAPAPSSSLATVREALESIRGSYMKTLEDDSSDMSLMVMPHEHQVQEARLKEAIQASMVEMGEQRAARELFFPLLQDFGLQTTSRVFQTVQMNDETVASVLTHLQAMGVDGNDLAFLLRGAAAQWEAQELAQTFAVWRDMADGLAVKEEMIGVSGEKRIGHLMRWDSFEWGERVGVSIPRLTVAYAKDLVIHLIQGPWEKSMTLKELQTSQAERMEGKMDLRAWRELKAGQEGIRALDVENMLATTGGVFSTWSQRWSGEQFGFLFKELAQQQSLHCKKRYPEWFDEFAYHTFTGDMMASAALAMRRPRDRMMIDNMIHMCTDGWSHSERALLVGRIKSRLQELPYLQYPFHFLYHKFVLHKAIERKRY